MVCYSDDFNCRAMNFPVVIPCESVSQKTLINSLISLVTKISAFKSRGFDYPFTSNKRNAKNVIRLIDILLIFLSEVQDGVDSDLPETADSFLSNLHVVLQKIRFLLEDCTLPDARVWMLINSGSVSGHFRALIGSLVEALEGLEIEGDERECVLFLISQGKKTRFQVERDDLRFSNLIFSAMGQIENRVIPDPNKLRLVMDYLSIKNWSDCNKQVRFLEEETGSDSHAKTLMGFMVYCRCVLFQSIEDGNKRLEFKDDIGFDMGCFNPDDFKCPISLEFMTDPVIVSSGHTYDRSSIMKWFKSGNPVCPKTGQKLESLDLVPNLVVKQLIKQYCLQKGISVPVSKSDPKYRRLTTKSGYIGSLAVQETTKMVAEFLSIKLAVGSMAEKNKAAYEIRLLAKRSEFNSASFLESGVIHSLLNLLLLKDSNTQENSMAALLNLSKHPNSKATIVDNGGLTLIIRVLKRGIKNEARNHAAGCLFYLSSVEEYRRLIGENADVIPSLVELIRVGGDQGRKNALITIFALLLLPTNHKKILESRLLPHLVTLLGVTKNKELVTDSLAVLSALAENPDGATAIFHAGALNVIMEIMCSSCYDSSRFARENCVSLLLALSTNCGKEVVEILAKKPSLMGALYSLITEGSSRASKKATSVITILHDFTEST